MTDMWTRAFLAALVVLGSIGCSLLTRATPCEVREQVFLKAEFEVQISAYRGELNLNKSLLILPPTGGTNFIDRSYAKRFCEAGFNVYILNGWTGDSGTSTDLEIHQGFYSRMLSAVDLALENIKSDFVGIFGTSLGGLYASVAVSKIERFDAVFTVASGAPIADVIVASDQEKMLKLKEARRQRFGFLNDKDYVTAIGRVFSLEPMLKPSFSKKRDFGMAIAEEDTTVPTDNQHLLRDFWKPHTLISLENGHFWAIVNTWLHYDEEIIDFFNASAKRTLQKSESATESGK